MLYLGSCLPIRVSPIRRYDMTGPNSCQSVGIPEFSPRLNHFMERLKAIYQTMDEAYAEVAKHYGCTCESCDGNCCTSYFFHYTVAEYLYLAKGFKCLNPKKQNDVIRLAHKFNEERDRVQAEGGKIGLMCPLNEGGHCGLYAFRPMICRLHGVPHSYRRPDLVLVQGGGCPKLVSPDIDRKIDKRLDRSPFYTEMAMIEQDLRREIGFHERVRMTIADMVLAMENGEA